LEQQIVQLFKFTRNTYYVWKKQKRPIINLLDTYFSEAELEEFLKSGKIQKLELMKSYLDDYDLSHHFNLFFNNEYDLNIQKDDILINFILENEIPGSQAKLISDLTNFATTNNNKYSGLSDYINYIFHTNSQFLINLSLNKQDNFKRFYLEISPKKYDGGVDNEMSYQFIYTYLLVKNKLDDDNIELAVKDTKKRDIRNKISYIYDNFHI